MRPHGGPPLTSRCVLGAEHSTIARAVLRLTQSLEVARGARVAAGSSSGGWGHDRESPQNSSAASVRSNSAGSGEYEDSSSIIELMASRDTLLWTEAPPSADENFPSRWSGTCGPFEGIPNRERERFGATLILKLSSAATPRARWKPYSGPIASCAGTRGDRSETATGVGVFRSCGVGGYRI